MKISPVGGRAATIFYLYSALVCLLLVTFALVARLSDGEQAETSTDVPPTEMLIRVQHFCDQLVTDGRPRAITAVDNGTASHFGKSPATWTVECITFERNLNFVFERTGSALLLFRQQVHVPRKNTLHKRAPIQDVTVCEAVGHRYLRLLGLEETNRCWVLDATTRARGHIWLMHFRQGNEHASVNINADTGELLQFLRE